MLVASKLSRMKNDPQSFTNWLQELFLPDDADKIIDAIRDNRFDKNFGTKMIDTSSDLLEEVSFNGVPLMKILNRILKLELLIKSVILHTRIESENSLEEL